MKKAFLALATLFLSHSAYAEKDDCCDPISQATCHAEGCECTYCLGPDNEAANAPVRPKTCNGDIAITVAGLYWNAHQDGMEFAIDNHVAVPANPTDLQIEVLNTLVDSHYQSPDFSWNFGFKLGLSYAGCHDGWDYGVLWTWYRGDSSSQVEADTNDNHTLITLWSDYSPPQGIVTYATDIKEKWDLDLDLIDLEVGREHWASKYLSLRPHVGIRIAYIKQSFDLNHKGGSFGLNENNSQMNVAFNNFVKLGNDFKGAGLLAGLDSIWRLGCGWGIYGSLATSLVYGKFSVKHDEWNREATDLHSKIDIFETDYSFRAIRTSLDLALGVEWMTMFCDCCYGLTTRLAWEQHLFFHQNQFWRIVRLGDTFEESNSSNTTGQNIYHHRKGTLDMQGITLTVQFTF
ncbi:MAG: hypothetical protein KR126chlam1_00506 [Chlamydiae bacterium]|nr:hypothetical protein [Chlamydiota bacterium]